MQTKNLIPLIALPFLMSDARIQAGFTVLHEFKGLSRDVQQPNGSLAIRDSTFYGASQYGGFYDVGVLYKIDLNGSGYETQRVFGVDTDGFYPVGGVTIVDSFLYGCTDFGKAGPGVVYRMKLDGTDYSVIHQFNENDGLGEVPAGGLLAIGSRLYGATIAGGDMNRGTLFSLNTDGSEFDVIHHFAGGSEDGRWPTANLIADGDRIYGMTRFGGAENRGTVYGINLDGTELQVLHSLAGVESEYQGSLSLLQIGSTLYGTTPPSQDNFGSVFRINSDGTGFETLYEFPQDSDDYQRPTSGLVLIGSTLYGTTAAVQRNYVRGGSIYKLNLDGSGFEVVHEFDNVQVPAGRLTVVGSKFYGTTLGSFNDAILYSYAVPEPSGAALVVGGVLSLSLFSFLSNRRRLNGGRRY